MCSPLTRETSIEASYVKWVAGQRGVFCVKFEHEGREGAPDRQIFLENGKTFFIEFKRPGGQLRTPQKRYHRMLQRMGFEVYTCYSRQEAIKATLTEIANNAPDI